MKKRLFSTLLLVLAACVSGPTGPEAANRFNSFEAVETADFTGYDKVHLERPVAASEITDRVGRRVLLSPTRRSERPLGQQDIDENLDRLLRELTIALQDQVELVEAPGPGILTISTTLTELDANRPTQAELVANPGLSMQSISTGAAAVEIELSEDGRVLARLSDSDQVAGLADPEAQTNMIWGTANWFYSRLGRKISALLEG